MSVFKLGDAKSRDGLIKLIVLAKDFRQYSIKIRFLYIIPAFVLDLTRGPVHLLYQLLVRSLRVQKKKTIK